ncbi:MAG: UDP-glucose 4-epimerase GalE [Pseudomonadota bacterium]
MRILCTGGAGYVGSHCLRHFRARGHEVVAFDNLAEGNRAAVGDAPLVVGDIRDRDALRAALSAHRIDAVAHFAALISVPASIKDPRAYWSVNVEGSQALLDAMVDTGVTRLVVSSTAAVYDHDAPMPLRETSALAPATPYGTSKLAMEHMVRDYARAYGLAATALRYFNAAGAEPDGSHGEWRREESHVLPLLMLFALGQRPAFKVFGQDWPTADGSCVRDFISLTDLAAAHLLALEGAASGEMAVYNLGTGHGTSVLELLGAAEEVIGRPLGWTPDARRPGDPAVLVADAELIAERLGWRPTVSSIREIVAAAWAWHESHPQGYGPHAAEAARTKDTDPPHRIAASGA